jgi:hypothetical protein
MPICQYACCRLGGIFNIASSNMKTYKTQTPAATGQILFPVEHWTDTKQTRTSLISLFSYIPHTMRWLLIRRYMLCY